MLTNLILCGACSRHVRQSELTCPFCKSLLAGQSPVAGARSGAGDFGRATNGPSAALLPGSSRSRRHAARAVLFASGTMVACGGSTQSTTTVNPDAGQQSGGGSGGMTGSGGVLSSGGTGGGSTGGSGTGGVSSGGSGSGGVATGGVGSGGVGTGGVGTGGSGTGGVGTGGGSTGGSGAGGQPCAGSQNPTGVPLCRANADCTGLAQCVMSPPSRCGNPAFQPHQCVTDGECQSGYFCETTACGGQICSPKCAAASCDGTCVGNICQPKQCNQAGGPSCAPNAKCSPGTAGADTYGCVKKACSADKDCSCGYCVNSMCETKLGYCYEIIAMPYGCVWPDEELV